MDTYCDTCGHDIDDNDYICCKTCLVEQYIPRAKLLALVAELDVYFNQCISKSDSNSIEGHIMTAIEINGRAIGCDFARKQLRTLLDETEGDHADDHLP